MGPVFTQRDNTHCWFMWGCLQTTVCKLSADGRGCLYTVTTHNWRWHLEQHSGAMIIVACCVCAHSWHNSWWCDIEQCPHIMCVINTHWCPDKTYDGKRQNRGHTMYQPSLNCRHNGLDNIIPHSLMHVGVGIFESWIIAVMPADRSSNNNLHSWVCLLWRCNQIVICSQLN